MDFVTLTLAKKYTDKTMKDGIPPETIEDAVEKYLTENPPAGGGSTLKQAAVITTTENANSIEVNGLNLKLPITILVGNAGTVVGGGLLLTVNGARDKYNGYFGSINDKGGEIWIYHNGEKMLGRALMSNTATNKYEWNISPATVITSIGITSPYNDGTNKYYAAGTTLTIYEGVFPRVIL